MRHTLIEKFSCAACENRVSPLCHICRGVLCDDAPRPVRACVLTYFEHCSQTYCTHTHTPTPMLAPNAKGCKRNRHASPYVLTLRGVTYSRPEQRVHTNDPIVMLTYVGPRWPQSKHCLLPPSETISRSVFRCLSSCFLRTTAMLLLGLVLVIDDWWWWWWSLALRGRCSSDSVSESPTAAVAADGDDCSAFGVVP